MRIGHEHAARAVHHQAATLVLRLLRPPPAAAAVAIAARALAQPQARAPAVRAEQLAARRRALNVEPHHRWCHLRAANVNVMAVYAVCNFMFILHIRCTNSTTVGTVNSTNKAELKQ
jgi:hypothetical protein